MNGFQDTGTRAAGVLPIGEELDRRLLGWSGSLVTGRVRFGILASGVVRILEAMDGIQGIGGLVVDGMAGVGMDLDGDLDGEDTDLDGDRTNMDGEDADLDGEGLALDLDSEEDLDLDSVEDLALDSEGGPDLVDPEEDLDLDLDPPERLDLDNMEGPDLDNEGESKGT